MRPLLLAALLLAPAPAFAQPARTLVLTFAGPSAGSARDAVLSALAPEVQLVPEETAIAAAQDLGVDLGLAEGFAALLAHLEITLVVGGSVEGRGRRATTTIMVMDAAGSELARNTGPGPSDGLVAIGEAAVAAIHDAQAALHRRENPEPEPPPPEPEPDVQPAPEPEPVVPEAPLPGWRTKQLLLLAGLRLRTVGTYVTDDVGNEHFFTADMYPEIDLDLAFRPYWNADSDMRGLVFGVRGTFSVGIAYLGPTGLPLGMTSYRFQLDVGYAYLIADMVEVIGTVGFGVDGVALDQPDAFPSMAFSYLRAMATVRVRIVPDFVIAEGGIGGRIGLDGGPLASAFGPSLYYGGVEVFAGVSGSIDPGFAWAARLGYQFHAIELEGLSGLYANGVGGVDEAIDLRLLIGWTF